MAIDLVRERSNLDRLSLWKSRFRVLSLKRIIKGGLRRGLKHMSVQVCMSMHLWVHESGSVWEAHSWSLGVRESQARVYHFIIGNSEIGRQSGMELGQRFWTVCLSAKQISMIVNFWTFLEYEIKRYTECWFSQVGFPG